MARPPRYLRAQVEEDLQHKMVFVAGPRQVGKTTSALSLAGAQAGYMSWDVSEHRERILRSQMPPGDLWIFDEIHKYRTWRNYLKGLYDKRPAGQRMLAAGRPGSTATISAAIRSRAAITSCECIHCPPRSWA